MNRLNTFTNITDAWFSFINIVINDPSVYKQDIQRGSFANESYRLQIPFTSCTILNPLSDYVPTVPDGIAPPVTEEYIKTYFLEYILGTKQPGENEQYTYATRIGDQLRCVLEMLKQTPYTNQATIEVGRPEDVRLSDPACLRVIDFKVVNERLEISTFWRTHDLWAGFPANLAALGMLQDMVAEYIGFTSGNMNYASSGLHLYSYQITSALAKLGKTSRRKLDNHDMC